MALKLQLFMFLLDYPIHFNYLFYQCGSGEFEGNGCSNPRSLVSVENGAEIQIIEKFLSGDGGNSYWANLNLVLELVIGSGGEVKHSYIPNQSLNASHIKWTSVLQVLSPFRLFNFVGSFGDLFLAALHLHYAHMFILCWECDQT